MPTIPINGIASPTVTTSYTDQATSCTMNLPLTRRSHLGVRPISMTGVALYLSGNGSSRTVTSGVWGARTSPFAIANAGSASLQSSHSLTANALDTAVTTSATVGTYSPSGSYHLGRAPMVGNTITGFSGGSGQTLVGTLTYIQVPTAPYDLVLTPGSGDITATWSVPTDDGDSAITGYSIEYADNADFVGSTVVTSATTSKTFSVTGGSDYFVRVAAQNAFYLWSEKPMSEWSAVASTSAGISGFRWDGSQEVALTVAMRWDGSEEIPITTAVRWDGSEEVPLS